MPALRNNPRRAQLWVSTVLGKHVGVDPRVIDGFGRLLGALVTWELGGRSGDPVPLAWSDAADEALSGRDPGALSAALPPAPTGGTGPVVVGYAETATALGHCVADAMDARFVVHTTRRLVPGSTVSATFEESHSHASTHYVTAIPALTAIDGDTLVLVDDELSTGRTALATISALHADRRRDRYVIAALVDLRPASWRAIAADTARELGCRIDVVALATGEAVLEDDLPQRAAALIAALPPVGDPDPGDSPGVCPGGAGGVAGNRAGRRSFRPATRRSCRFRGRGRGAGGCHRRGGGRSPAGRGSTGAGRRYGRVHVPATTGGRGAPSAGPTILGGAPGPIPVDDPLPGATDRRARVPGAAPIHFRLVRTRPGRPPLPLQRLLDTRRRGTTHPLVEWRVCRENRVESPAHAPLKGRRGTGRRRGGHRSGRGRAGRVGRGTRAGIDIGGIGRRRRRRRRGGGPAGPGPSPQRAFGQAAGPAGPADRAGIRLLLRGRGELADHRPVRRRPGTRRRAPRGPDPVR